MLRLQEAESSLYILGGVEGYLTCKMGIETLQDIKRFVLLYAFLGLNGYPKCKNVDKQASIFCFLQLCL